MSTLDKVDKLGEKLVDLVEMGVDKVPISLQKLMEFTETQAPLLMGDIVSYGRAMAVVKTLGLLISYVVPGYLWFKFNQYIEKSKDPFGWGIGAVVTSIIVICVTIIYFANLDKMIQPWFAPRLYLLNYLKELVR